MSRNRIASYQVPNPIMTAAANPESQPRGAGMVAVSISPQAVTWQQTLYQMAYQKAVEQLAPPRHHSRFFAVWN